MLSRNRLFDRLQRRLSESRRVVKGLVKLRNQCNMIIGASFSKGPRIEENGEALIIRKLAPFCDSFMDVGANKGEWSDVALSAGFSRGIVVEPNPTAFEWLKEKYRERAEIVVGQWLLSEGVSDVEYYYDGDFDVYASMFVERGSAIKMSTTRIDEKISSIDFLKIDAEGSECAILKGAQKLLATGAVRFIQFEYNSAWLAGGGTLTWALRTLDNYGYTIFLIREKGLYQVDHEYFGEHHGYANYLAVHNAYAEAVSALVGGQLP